jgi:acetyl-CoA carboxylase carboxyl transferase subunit alpha
MAQLRVPIIAVVIGEGGSGGALALAVADRVLMLQHSTYSVISPEGCASILWRSAERAPDAAQALGINSERLKSLGLIDEIIPEPLGGAHRNHEEMAATLRVRIRKELGRLTKLSAEQLITVRHKKTLSYGKFKLA